MSSHTNWSLSRRPQIGVAALAVAMTAALLSALQGTHVRRIDGPPGKVMVWLPALSPKASAPIYREKRRAGQPIPPAKAGLRHSAPARTTEPFPAVPPAPHPGDPPVPVPEAPRGPATLNLQLRDVDARSGRSSLRQQADRAGTYMGDARLSEQGRLAQSVTRAAKAGCLASNEHGSLLSIFRIAYDAVTDRCK
ncbi:hypothetical protein RAMLITH_12715 [Ramlibacter sp. RBP-2]|uniref:Uncharacterized protein n=1 Tax=Ramlibacter lithotrophicus TaxID=2606681 RepID=A0A7X6DGF6_9BURK|nr:hypothetical protein [Ramlibacter lithotrophicus]NKE66688.1 hypothetical protein [Ramlibacter lithotrophicus]